MIVSGSNTRLCHLCEGVSLLTHLLANLYNQLSLGSKGEYCTVLYLNEQVGVDVSDQRSASGST